jgi:DNA-binding transcriptional regulator YiaG
MPTDKRKAANIRKATRTSSVTEVLAIRVPVGLTKEQRSEARQVAQDAVENWNTLRKMYGGLKY